MSYNRHSVIQVEDNRSEWHGRAVRRGDLQQDDGGRTAAERGRHQRRAAAQKRPQVCFPPIKNIHQ